MTTTSRTTEGKTRAARRSPASNRTMLAADAAAVEAARHAGLIHVRDTDAGLRRLREGRDFRYVDARGRPIEDPAVLARIRALAIPPAYEDVWISADPRGHLQATGRDTRGRKQYRYHPRWRAVRDDDKFGRMVAFGTALPRLKRRLRCDLAGAGTMRDKVLAAMVGILMQTRLRVGNDVYAEQNHSYGLTTLRSQHVRLVREGGVTLRFRGKGGRPHEVTVGDRRLATIVRRCHELPGQRLFQYVGEDGRRHRIDSGLLNDYLARAMGGPFTAKDFRTWAATLEAIERLACVEAPADASERAKKRCEKEVVDAVAESLRNTPTVCRKSYINPAVFDWWRDGRLQHAWSRDRGGRGRKAERLAIGLLGVPSRRTRDWTVTAKRRHAAVSTKPAHAVGASIGMT